MSQNNKTFGGLMGKTLRKLKNLGKKGGKTSMKEDKVKGDEKEPELTAEQLDELALQDAFNKFDTDGNQFIDKQELSNLLIEFLNLKEPPTEVQIARILAQVDLNNDGKIDFSEFKIMMSGRLDTKNKYLATFKNFDLDDDGYITPEELKDSMRKVHTDTTDEEIEKIMATLDQNDDGKISFQEFLAFFVA